jgi:ribonuclease P/MRP protein subunit POP3
VASKNNYKTRLTFSSLLSQIGQYRSHHVTYSRGKRSKKRKRHEAKAGDAPTMAIPPPPEISSFLVVGLNSITRNLESSSQRSQPKTHVAEGSEGNDLLGTVPDSKVAKEGSRNDISHPLNEGHLSAILVCRSSQSSVLHEHLPQLVFTASLANPMLPATRLVELPNGSEARVCEALGIPRVSSIGILEGAPHSKPLIDLLRECVPEIEIPWLQQAKESRYLPVKVNSIETLSTVVKKVKS